MSIQNQNALRRFSGAHRLVISGATLAMFGGCGAHQGTAGAVTQAVARVNGHELTVSQLNREMLKNGSDQEDPVRARQVALERLITKELIIQAAESEKLDREAGVRAQIEESRRRVLARAYAEQKIFPSDQLDDAQLREFYEAHPLLFKNRRVYHAEVLTIADSASVPSQVTSQLTQSRTVDSLRALLGRYGIAPQQRSIVRAAEDLPENWLPTLASTSVGDVVPLKDAGGQLQVMLLTAVDAAPIAFDEARPWITRYLQARRNEDALKSYIAKQRTSARIEYGAGYDAPLSSQ